MPLAFSKLERIRDGHGKTIARCPACAETGGDTTGNHLFINPDGAFGCVQFPGDENIEHRRRIAELAGDDGERHEKRGDWNRPSSPATAYKAAEPREKRKITLDTPFDHAYVYTDAEGETLFEVRRYSDPKDFRPFKHENGVAVYGMDGAVRVPYRLPQVIAADTVWIVEGEKDADNLARLGFRATCRAGGSSKWEDELTPHFAGKHVVLCGDNDAPGRKYMDAVAAKLKGTAASIKRVEVPEAHKDISDALAGLPDAEARALIDGLTGTENEVSPESSWLDAISKSVLTPSEAAKLKMPKRERILGEWFCTSDLGFIYGPRGLGKTWLAMLIARALSEGKPVGPWQAAKPCCVMYVDGEMAYDASFERAHQLMPMVSENFHLLHHEAVFHLTGKALNLTSLEAQAALTEECVKRGVKALFIDNLSCLFTLKENDSDDWGERVLPWLLHLRRRGISVVFVAHAGRNGLMRGTSKREDSAFWSIKLTPSAEADGHKGAAFIASFDKNRNTTDENAQSLLWRFTPQKDGSVLPMYQSCAPLDVFISLVSDGLTRCGDIAEEMKVSKGFVSKLANRAVAAGRITINGRDYAPKQ